MKKIIYVACFLLFAGIVNAQPIFDLGLKAGVCYSNMKIDNITSSDFDSEGITQTQWGAFARLGFNRLYVQPEAYFSKKGGKLTSGVDVVSDFDYSSIDVPVLLGYKLVKGSLIDFRIMAGPVFDFVLDSDFSGDDVNFDDCVNDNMFGFQYGIGVDVLFLTVDARMEHMGTVIDANVFSSKSNTFMLSVGFKIL